jgi:hypothetical protein
MNETRQYGRLLKRPQIEGRGERKFVLRGRAVDLFSKNRLLERVLAVDSAEAVSGDLDLKSDSIDLRITNNKLSRAHSWGATGARAVSTDRTITADSLDVQMPNQRVSEVHAVRRAYADILGRPPDNQGLAKYRNHMVNDRWTERQVRDALMNSPEYREKSRMTREKADEIVKSSYRSVLGRDPDAAGLRSYSDKILREKWTESDVTRSLRQSDEYKKKHK